MRQQITEMGSKERIIRHKEDIRRRIMHATLQLSKENGWNAVSMRKIADLIEYSAPAIYEYFNNKEDLLRELTRQGFLTLTYQLKLASNAVKDPRDKLHDIWIAYWNFALAEQELYQIMFGIEYTCCDHKQPLLEARLFVSLVQDIIRMIIPNELETSLSIQKYYYTFWSITHGLVSINLIRDDVPENISIQVLTEAIDGIIQTFIQYPSNDVK